eukprot:GILK01006439.1.p1 GENE.GILK01006439.1~~GILK01006439.1.p1  ORF type:complete len:490 (+),score=94.02 GILK01006439.1:59-1471(+)
MAASDEYVSFERLGVSNWLIKNCENMGIRTPTPIQVRCIPSVLAGKNVIACALTGSGKTATFALPILQKLSEEPYGVFALVLTPTRELAFQIADQFRALGATMGLKDAVIVGGMDMMTQALALSKRPHVVIATPGRLADHLEKDPSHVKLFKGLQFVVLDEADRLMDSSFRTDLDTILTVMPTQRQTLLFSATMTKNMEDLNRFVGDREPVRFDVNPPTSTVDTLNQQFMFMPAKVKECYLLYLLKQFGDISIIIFTSTCRSCQLITTMLQQLEFSATCLHSLQSQQRRLASVGKFKSGVAKILVATDVASRGLDIPSVELVVNFDVPRMVPDYIHRVGRTARAGRIGLSVTLISQYDIQLVQKIEDMTGKKMEERPTEEREVLQLLNTVATALQAAKLQLLETGFEEKVTKAREDKRKRRQQQTEHTTDKKHNRPSSGASSGPLKKGKAQPSSNGRPSKKIKTSHKALE